MPVCIKQANITVLTYLIREGLISLVNMCIIFYNITKK